VHVDEPTTAVLAVILGIAISCRVDLISQMLIQGFVTDEVVIAVAVVKLRGLVDR